MLHASHNAARRLSFQVATDKLHGPTMGDQVILEEDYNEDYDPTDDGLYSRSLK